MLKQLFIKDMLIISRLELEFEQGLNVLTGETGAGKSILLDSLGFVLGWRGRADLVRKGAEQGEVLAIFDVSQNAPAKKALIEAGLSEGDELILRRINAKDGRKRRGSMTAVSRASFCVQHPASCLSCTVSMMIAACLIQRVTKLC